MWVDNSCSTNFGRVMSLTLRIFTHFSLSSKTPPTSFHGFEWNLAGMCHYKSRSACGEIIHVRQILAELWSMTLTIVTRFSLFSKLLLHPCMNWNETWQGCCITILEVHMGREFMRGKFWQSYGPWHLEFLHILSCLLNSSYIFASIWMKLGRDVTPQV